jgi:peptidyl-prolyl cis-trans isomerase SurA
MMKSAISLTVLLLGLSIGMSGQVAAHSNSFSKQPVTQGQAARKPVAKVNGTVLTEVDLLREMYIIFPYARVHNGFPKAQEAAIRKGALEMIVFEELVYQEAERRKLPVAEADLSRGVAQFKKQFHGEADFRQYLNEEFQGSQQKFRGSVRRSLLIDRLLRIEVDAPAKVSVAEAKAYYEKNIGKFLVPESFAFQSISIMPPERATPEQMKEARKKADEALKQAKATKTYEQFGLLAEKISEDNYRVDMGDHRVVSRDALPPEVVNAALKMSPGQVSGLIQLDTVYTLFRLNKHLPARTKPFTEVQAALRKDMEKNKTEQLRAALSKRLRAAAKTELL